MDIYLMRHTKTAASPGLCYGQSDIELAESFAEELVQIREKMPKLAADCPVFSSPLSRCLQLAEKFSDNVSTDARLLELNFGDWEGQRFDDIETGLLKHWTDNFVHTAPPNGESFEDLCRRAGSFWQDLLATQAEQVVVVTHAGTIRALLARILTLPLANAFQLRINLGSLHKLQHQSDYTMIDFLNR
jgi:alpha-ribazole phosphatase